MTPTTRIRKVFQGIASRQQMCRMFNRHAKRPNRLESDGSTLYAGEWFEIAETEYDYMLEMLPPLWMRFDSFAMREFLTGSVTGVFFTLRIDGRTRYFHSYCDLSDKDSPERMRQTILERERHSGKAMTREERLEHIWSITHDDYRGYASDTWAAPYRGKRTILTYGGQRGTTLKLLDDLTDDEITQKLPVHLRYLPLAA